ncbi:MAG: hypothetical protein NT159_23935 [Proteobacteria bacterium]|nr:hypothetical protein [Pseudomonadota bacterium]
MTNDQFRRYAAIAALVAVPLLVPLLLNDPLSGPLSRSECVRVKAVGSSGKVKFSIDGLSGTEGRPIYGGRSFARIEGGRICGFDDAPMSFHGSTELPPTASVWLVSTSDSGQHYLSPRIQIMAGEWVASDIRMGGNIVTLSFMQVDTATDQDFRAQVNNRNWRVEWPGGAIELAALTFEQERRLHLLASIATGRMTK